jgi:hypothetical protein
MVVQEQSVSPTQQEWISLVFSFVIPRRTFRLTCPSLAGNSTDSTTKLSRQHRGSRCQMRLDSG